MRTARLRIVLGGGREVLWPGPGGGGGGWVVVTWSGGGEGGVVTWSGGEGGVVTWSQEGPIEQNEGHTPVKT